MPRRIHPVKAPYTNGVPRVFEYRKRQRLRVMPPVLAMSCRAFTAPPQRLPVRRRRSPPVPRDAVGLGPYTQDARSSFPIRSIFTAPRFVSKNSQGETGSGIATQGVPHRSGVPATPCLKARQHLAEGLSSKIVEDGTTRWADA
jgi:hypothetical protein